MKRKCAVAALNMIKDGMVVGLGGGSTVSMLIEEIEKSGLRIFGVTPSEDTMQVCLEHHIPMLPLAYVSHVDIAFDGCDELDEHLNALKSCGGIHTREKIVASLSDDYVLLTDEEKYKPALTNLFPVVLEVIPSAKAYVEREVLKLACTIHWRSAAGKAGLQLTDDGNYLLDMEFEQLPEIEALSSHLKSMVGVVDISLFYGVATKAIIAGKNEVRIIERDGGTK